MSTSLTLGAIWALIAAIVALLPMRLQLRPGIVLLVSAPLLIVFIGVQHGLWIAGLGVLAFISMFRNPLRYLLRKALGKPTPLPPELQRRKP